MIGELTVKSRGKSSFRWIKTQEKSGKSKVIPGLLGIELYKIYLLRLSQVKKS